MRQEAIKAQRKLGDFKGLTKDLDSKKGNCAFYCNVLFIRILTGFRSAPQTESTFIYILNQVKSKKTNHTYS